MRNVDMKTMLRSIIAAALAITLVLPAAAWGKTGHRVTGKIAEAYLTPEALAAITDILGSENLAEASIWADVMRGSPDGIWPRAANAWHYVTIPQGKTYADVGAPESGDAITALAGFGDTLRSETASKEEKALALRFAVHIIGDLHQPLHAGNGTDDGGNWFTVAFFNKATNLHAVWDSGMIDDEQLSFTEMAEGLSRSITPEQAAAWQQVDPVVWVTESAAIRDTIYPDDVKLMGGYVFDHQAEYRTRLSQAGVRMAAYLNEVFAAPN
jgi:hypothetical protein